MKTEYSSGNPLQIALKGAVAGLGATLILSVASRLTFGVMDRSPRQRPGDGGERDPREEHPAVLTPGGALAQSEQAGPEGAAGRFALKVGTGLFGRDISPHGRLAGEALHFAYGTFWGSAFGLIYASRPRQPWRTSAALGLALYGLGPATLVPAMKLMPPPQRYPLPRTALLIGGHLLYGFSTLYFFRKLG